MILRFALLLLLGVAALRAQTNSMLIPFQGRLTDQQGNPRTNGVYTLIFNLYDQAVGGSNLWTERHEKVGVVNGMVNVFLGSITPLDSPAPGVDFASTRYLGITVDADQNSNTSDPEMVPRQMIIPAFWARNSDKLAGADWRPIFGVNSPTGSISGAKLTANSVGREQLAAGGVTTTALASGAVTFEKMAIRGYSSFPTEARLGSLAYSGPLGGVKDVSGTWQAIDGSTLIVTNAGGPMLVTLSPNQGGGESGEAYISVEQTSTVSNEVGILMGLFDGESLVGATRLYFRNPTIAGDGQVLVGAKLMIPGSFAMTLVASPGRHHYTLRIKGMKPEVYGSKCEIFGRLSIIDL